MSNQDFILALHRQLITLGVAVHRDSLETAVANALRTAGTTVEQGWQPFEMAPLPAGPEVAALVQLVEELAVDPGRSDQWPGTYENWRYFDNQRKLAVRRLREILG